MFYIFEGCFFLNWRCFLVSFASQISKLYVFGLLNIKLKENCRKKLEEKDKFLNLGNERGTPESLWRLFHSLSRYHIYKNHSWWTFYCLKKWINENDTFLLCSYRITVRLHNLRSTAFATEIYFLFFHDEKKNQLIHHLC